VTVFTVTTIELFEVHFVDAVGGPAGARDAFRRLEAYLPSLRGRRLYGLYELT
jgi:hypothetical protein